MSSSASRLIPAGTLILATRVCVGKWNYLTAPLAINQDLTALTVEDKRVLPEYMKCVAPGIARRIDAAAVGTGVRGVPRAFLNNIEIPLPSIEEQRNVIAEVDTCEHLLRGARQILETWEPDFEESSDWERIPLSTISTFSYGHPAIAQTQGEARYVRISDIDKTGRLKPHKARYIPLDPAASRRLCQRGDVFIARIGFSAGKSLYFDSDETSVFASYLIKVALSEKLLSKFFWYFTQTKDYATQRDRLFSGGAQPHFNTDAIGQIEVPLPPLDVQKKIVARLDREFERIDAVRGLVDDYEGRVSKILDKLWNGKQGDIDAPPSAEDDDEDEDSGASETEDDSPALPE